MRAYPVGSSSRQIALSFGAKCEFALAREHIRVKLTENNCCVSCQPCMCGRGRLRDMNAGEQIAPAAGRGIASCRAAAPFFWLMMMSACVRC